MKKGVRKLTLSRETLWRLEGRELREAAGGANSVPSHCECLTDLCITAGYTGCSACNCA